MQTWTRTWKVALSLALAFVVTCTTGCASTNGRLKRFEYTGITMGVDARIVLFAADESTARNAARQAMAEMDALDQVMSDYRPDSELMQLCAQPTGTWVAISEPLADVIARGQALARASGGAFDMTAGALTQLWRTARREEKLPARDDIGSAMARMGWEHLEVDAPNRRARLTLPGMRLDLGGIGKGFAVDRAALALRQSNINSYLVSLAGDIALGNAPPGTVGWTITLDPGWDDGVNRVQSLHMANVSISTSGESMQFLEVDGKRYSHIIDPRNGQPIEKQRAVTVIALDTTTSDSLATALCVLDETAASDLLAQYTGCRALVQRREDNGWREVRASTVFDKNFR